jgi:hypothetical protein
VNSQYSECGSSADYAKTKPRIVTAITRKPVVELIHIRISVFNSAACILHNDVGLVDPEDRLERGTRAPQIARNPSPMWPLAVVVRASRPQ